MAKITITVEDVDTPDGNTVNVSIESDDGKPDDFDDATPAQKIVAVMYAAGKECAEDVTDELYGKLSEDMN